MESYKLRKDFLLGVATASTQIEGGDTNNNWYEYSIDGTNTKDGTSSFVANDHYRLYKDDISLMKKMNIEIYRMSIEWSRIEPKEGIFDETAIEHYISELTFLKDNNIQVLMTLHHFSNPLWFEHKGGFTKKSNIHYFLEYVEYVGNKFKNIVNEYCTINEANVYAANSYLFGVWPPKQKKIGEARHVMKNLAICHIEAYKILHAIDNKCRVGFANHLICFDPHNKKKLFDRIGTNIFDKGFQLNLTKAMAWGVFGFPMGIGMGHKKDYFDFIGINYYTRNEMHFLSMQTKKNAEKNDLGWEIYPLGLRRLCEQYHHIFKKDIYITENGTCDKDDKFRTKYLYDHLKAIHDLDYVKRYYHWTFIDNWEWAEGQSACFGLVKCNYETQERTIRPSGQLYSEVIKHKEFTQELIEKYLQNTK